MPTLHLKVSSDPSSLSSTPSPLPPQRIFPSPRLNDLGTLHLWEIVATLRRKYGEFGGAGVDSVTDDWQHAAGLTAPLVGDADADADADSDELAYLPDHDHNHSHRDRNSQSKFQSCSSSSPNTSTSTITIPPPPPQPIPLPPPPSFSFSHWQPSAVQNTTTNPYSNYSGPKSHIYNLQQNYGNRHEHSAASPNSSTNTNLKTFLASTPHPANIPPQIIDNYKFGYPTHSTLSTEIGADVAPGYFWEVSLCLAYAYAYAYAAYLRYENIIR